jgi:disulfide bond formation protein DsbB
MFKRLKNSTISVYQNYFEIASCLGATTIILLAILMDKILALQACPMCMMTRYVFGIIAVISFLGFIVKKLFIIDKFLVVLASLAGMAVTGKQIYLQNLSPEEISNLPMGCGMPLETQIEYFGFFGGIANAYRGGPTCAEVNWSFIFNFAEWGFLFFVIFLTSSILKIFKV